MTHPITVIKRNMPGKEIWEGRIVRKKGCPAYFAGHPFFRFFSLVDVTQLVQDRPAKSNQQSNRANTETT
jgi:hypothetical protein